MKIRFLEKPAGTEYEAGQVAEFDDRDWVAMSYPQKYLREGIAEVVVDGPPIDADGLRTDGPTLEEYVAAGYKAEGYPPQGYADKRPEADRPAAGTKGGKKK